MTGTKKWKHHTVVYRNLYIFVDVFAPAMRTRFVATIIAVGSTDYDSDYDYDYDGLLIRCDALRRLRNRRCRTASIACGGGCGRVESGPQDPSALCGANPLITMREGAPLRQALGVAVAVGGNGVVRVGDTAEGTEGTQEKI